MDLNCFRDRLFDLLNDSEELGITDLNADEQNSLITVRTESRKVFEIVCREATGREDGRTQTDSLLWAWRIQKSPAADSFARQMAGTGRI